MNFGDRYNAEVAERNRYQTGVYGASFPALARKAFEANLGNDLPGGETALILSNADGTASRQIIAQNFDRGSVWALTDLTDVRAIVTADDVLRAQADWAPAPSGPPPATRVVFGADISNYQPEFSVNTATCWKQQGLEVAIVGVYPGAPQTARRQLGAAQAAGLRLMAYMVPYFREAPADWAQQCIDIVGTIPVERWWVDVEPDGFSNPTTAHATWCIDEMLRVIGDRPKGIYSAKWAWDRMGLPSKWSDQPLWNASYDGRPTLDVAVPYGGWTTAFAKQYTNTIDLCGVGCCRDVVTIT